jgi:hypothetical protein
VHGTTHLQPMRFRKASRRLQDPFVFAADEDESAEEREPREMTDELDAVDAGHLQVEQYDVGGVNVRFENGEGRGRVIEGHDIAEPQPFELVGQEAQGEGFVVDEEQLHGVASDKAFSTASSSVSNPVARRSTASASRARAACSILWLSSPSERAPTEREVDFSL